MARRRGLQAEVLASLSVVMLTATGVLGAVLLKTHEAHLRPLRSLAARSLVAEALSPLPAAIPSTPGIRWWTAQPNGHIRPHGPHDSPIDPESRRLAAEARSRNAPLLLAGPPWEAIRFAAPVGSGGRVAVAHLPAAVSPALLLGLLVADVVVFTAFGAYLLRRRLVIPLQRLAVGARSIADGALDGRVPVDGVSETAEVATAFNAMTEALEGRTRAVEKALSDLRESNRSLREARAGLDRAERLAAVGRLAAGVAHEVGNPMGAMLAFLDLVKRDGDLAASSRGYLDRAAREGERVRKILRQLLEFSRPPRVERRPVDVAAVCEETAGLVRAQRRYAGIAIEVVAEGDPPPALADPGSVGQIVLNLLLNAADALIGGTPEPTIRIAIRPAPGRVRAGEGASAAGGRRQFDAVECRVEDNGPGIAEEDRERIFDPFFSTKAPGEGTGLGLSNALRFAEELGGSLFLDTRREAPGAAFVLRLSAASEISPGVRPA